VTKVRCPAYWVSKSRGSSARAGAPPDLHWELATPAADDELRFIAMLFVKVLSDFGATPMGALLTQSPYDDFLIFPAFCLRIGSTCFVCPDRSFIIFCSGFNLVLPSQLLYRQIGLFSRTASRKVCCLSLKMCSSIIKKYIYLINIVRDQKK